jgi:hypothetical protein
MVSLEVLLFYNWGKHVIKKSMVITLSSIIVMILIVLYFVHFTNVFEKSYSPREIEMMKIAERELEKTLGEDVTITDIRKGGLYVGPIVVRGIINRVDLEFELQSDTDLRSFDYIYPYYSRILSIDAEREFRELVDSIFDDLVRFKVSIGGKVNKEDFPSYEELKIKYPNEIIYRINMDRSKQDIVEVEVEMESKRIYQLISEFKRNDKKLHELNIKYKKFSLLFSGLLHPNTTLTLQDIEESFRYKLENLKREAIQ